MGKGVDTQKLSLNLDTIYLFFLLIRYHGNIKEKINSKMCHVEYTICRIDNPKSKHVYELLLFCYNGKGSG